LLRLGVRASIAVCGIVLGYAGQPLCVLEAMKMENALASR
jgi:acetyl/propionyl-CoA carboxylase alpha subunit